jgi:hypothetical protein
MFGPLLQLCPEKACGAGMFGTYSEVHLSAACNIKGCSKDFQRVNSTSDVIDVAIHFIKVI